MKFALLENLFGAANYIDRRLLFNNKKVYFYIRLEKKQKFVHFSLKITIKYVYILAKQLT